MDKIIPALDQKHLPLSIFMDLCKAFNLINRKQYDKWNSISSITSTININTDVVQGSILAPVWFLIYINYMPNASNAFNFILYNDDSMLLSAIQNTLAMQQM